MAVLDNYEIRTKISNVMIDVSEITEPEDIIFVGSVNGQNIRMTLQELKDDTDSDTLNLGSRSTLYNAYLEAFAQNLTILRDWSIQKIYGYYVVEGKTYKSESLQGFVIDKFDWPFIITKHGSRILIDFKY